MTKFGENRPLRSCRKVAWIRPTAHKNSGSARLVQPPFCPKSWQNGTIAPKIPRTVSPLTCPRRPNLVRIGCALSDSGLFRKDWFFGPKKWTQYRLSAYNNLDLYSLRPCKVLSEYKIFTSSIQQLFTALCNNLHVTSSIHKTDSQCQQYGPCRLASSHTFTCSQRHNFGPESGGMRTHRTP